MRIGYARVSKREQNLALQLDALRRAGCAKIYRDERSAFSDRLPAREKAVAALRPGDQLVIWKLDRFARDLLDQLLTLRELQRRGASLLSLTECLDTGDWMGSIMSRQYAIYAEVEVQRLRERTRAGLAAARARGKKLGRRPKLTPAKIDKARTLLAEGMKVPAVARRCRVSRATLYRTLQRERSAGG